RTPLAWWRLTAVAEGRRGAAGPPRGRGKRAGVRRALRALSPDPVSLLPFAGAQRQRCAGRASVDICRGARRAPARTARRAAATVAVPNRSQRVRLDAPAAPAGRGPFG